MSRYLLNVLRFTTTLRIAWLLLSVAATVGITRLTFNDDYRSLFQADGQEYANYEQLISDFGSDENDFILLVRSEQILEPQTLSVINEIHEATDRLDETSRVISLFSLRDRRRVGKYLLPILKRDMATEALDEAVTKLRQHPLCLGNLLSHDESSTLIIVQLGNESLSVNEIAERRASLERIIEKATAGSATRVQMTGLPAMRVEIVRGVQRDQIILTSSAILLCSLLAWMMFRSITMIAVVCIAPFTGTFWTIGGMGLFGEPLNVLNTIVPTLLIVVGFTDSVHLMFEIRRQRDHGHSPGQATRLAVQHVGPACVLTSLTTAAGFASLYAVDDPLIQRFGVACAIGTLIVMVAVLTLIPKLAETRLGVHCVSRSHAIENSWETRLSNALASRTLHLPIRLAMIGIFSTGLLSILSLAITPDFRYSENLPSENETSEATKVCDKQFQGSSKIQIVVQWPSDVRLKDERLHSLIRDIHSVVDTQEETSKALSIRTILESLPGESLPGESPPSESPDLTSRLSELRYLPREAVSPFINLPQRRLTVSARVKDLGSARLLPRFTQLREALSRVSASYPGFQVHMTGVPVLSTFRSQSMIRDLARSLVTASVVVFVLLALAFRSVTMALISVVPNLFPLAATAASFVLLDQSLRYSGVVCFSVCLGIAVDDTIHFLARYRLERQRNAECSIAIRETLIAICPVLVTTTILTCTGFGVALLSVMPTIRLFGMTTCGALFFALLADLLFLPALLTVYERWTRRDAKPELGEG